MSKKQLSLYREQAAASIAEEKKKQDDDRRKWDAEVAAKKAAKLAAAEEKEGKTATASTASASPVGEPATAPALAPSPLPSPVSVFNKEGYLNKQGEKNTSWKQRYFRLVVEGDGYALHYFKTDTSAKLLGAIIVSGSTQIKLCEGVGGGAFVFGVTPVNARTYLLSAPDDGLRQEWVAVITNLIGGQ